MNTFSLIELKHLLIQYRGVLALKTVLLCGEQIRFASGELDDIFQTETELFSHKIVAGLSTFHTTYGRLEFLLVGVCLKPIVFDGTVKYLLLILKFQFLILPCQFCLVYGRLCRTVVKYRNTDTETYRTV